MPVQLEPIRPVKCTFSNCSASFNTEMEMKSHKKHAKDHDYCRKCDEDFDSFEDWCMHKAFRPDNHGNSCRICGEDIKSESGLRRHIKLAGRHPLNQKTECVGCGDRFFRASQFIEHLEFGHCADIPADQFQGHIVHKALITKLLDDSAAYSRFLQKVSHNCAAWDPEEGGGINLIDDNEALKVEVKAIQPELVRKSVKESASELLWPLLPSQAIKAGQKMNFGTSTFGKASLNSESATSTNIADILDPSVETQKTWKTGRTSEALFPNAKPTPVRDDRSVQNHDNQQKEELGLNMLSTRFWDPTSIEWDPERFRHPAIDRYVCPFVCERMFDIAADLDKHITTEHKIKSMKCPQCFKVFPSCAALVAHCENPVKKGCKIHEADDYGKFLNVLTGGFLSVREKTRPDHLNNPTIIIKNSETGFPESYRPPTVRYLQYEASKPADWKEPLEDNNYRIGGLP
ncbi:hypothetical protein CC78DRAFT_574752 [Lojkania enalia]|uniref:C2H2-type domain-containing protein n=1 Tax=Lojkania enalia TaxID=147567 RepID=A0A9P4NAY2_9PLEO|nr:hypothetical protein CC78DRAFT_574752 [Didymosphaeria enalia]